MRRMLAVLVIVALVGFVAVRPRAGGRPATWRRRDRHAASRVRAVIIAGEVLAAATTIPYRATAVVAGPGPYYAPAPTYYAPAPAYSTRSAYVEQLTVAPAPSYASYSAPAHTRVVRYANGSYVLRGDGVYTRYQCCGSESSAAPGRRRGSRLPRSRPPASRDSGTTLPAARRAGGLLSRRAFLPAALLVGHGFASATVTAHR